MAHISLEYLMPWYKYGMKRSGGTRGAEKSRRLAWNSDECQNPDKYQSFDVMDGHSVGVAMLFGMLAL